MFRIDTGERFIQATAQSASVDQTQVVRITNRGKAITLSNKITETIQAHECAEQLDNYWHREGLILDALHLFDPHVTAHLTDLYKEHRAALIHGGAYKSAQAVPHRTASGYPPARDGKTDKGNDYGF